MRRMLVAGISALLALAIVDCGNENSGNPTGAPTPEYVGTWEGLIDLSMLSMGTMKVRVEVNTNNTFTLRWSVDTVITRERIGTWTATADSIFLKATTCERLDETEQLAIVDCVDPTDPADSDTESLALGGISGNVWVISDPEFGSLELQKN